MRVPKPYDRTTHDGKPVDWITKAALLKAERILGYPLTIVQGSYQATTGDRKGAAASAGTHDGGGVVDLAEWDWPAKVRALRLSGLWAYRRPELWRNGVRVWSGHIHAVLEGNRLLSTAAEDQVDDARHGRNGLADNGPDPHAGFVFRPFRWPYAGPIGVVRWHLDHGNLTKAQRRAFRGRIVTRLNLTRKDLPK